MREKISDAKEINLRYNKSAFYKISDDNLDKAVLLSSEEGAFMKHKVIKKQENARQCFACGVDNPMGLKAFFYEMVMSWLLFFSLSRSIKAIQEDYTEGCPPPSWMRPLDGQL